MNLKYFKIIIIIIKNKKAVLNKYAVKSQRNR